MLSELGGEFIKKDDIINAYILFNYYFVMDTTFAEVIAHPIQYLANRYNLPSCATQTLTIYALYGDLENYTDVFYGPNNPNRTTIQQYTSPFCNFDFESVIRNAPFPGADQNEAEYLKKNYFKRV